MIFKRFTTHYMTMLFLLDILLIQLALSIAMQLRYALPFGQTLLVEWGPTFIYEPTLMLHLAVLLLWVVGMLFASVYTPRRVTFWYEEVQRIILAHTVSALCLMGLLYLAKKELPRLTFVYFYITALVLIFGTRLLLRIWHRLNRYEADHATRILIVGANEVGQDLVKQISAQQRLDLEFVGFVDNEPMQRAQSLLPILGQFNDITQIVHRERIDEVIIALPREAHIHLANLVTLLHQLPIRLHIVPDYFDLAFHGSTIEQLGSIPLIGLRDSAIDDFQCLTKRAMDIVFAATGLILSLPIMAIIAILIKLEDGGSIFYAAPRIGENSKRFFMLKFRSMVVNADQIQPSVSQHDEKGNTIFKVPNDPRVTQIGHFLRRTSLDELPQLINVLRGEMSLVGPRPELPWLVDTYEPWQRKRFAVPQGMTGWWQINGRSDMPMNLHTEQDLYYIQNYSLWLDIQILWRTIGVILRGKGAY